MLKDLFKMNIFHDTDEGVGAGGKDTPNTEGSQEETPEGAGQPEIVIGDEKFDRNDPELISKLTVKANNLQTGLTRKSQELSKLKKETPKPQVKETPKETKPAKVVDDLATKRINRMYEKSINTEFDTFINEETIRLSGVYGENFDKVKDEFAKEAISLKKFDLSIKEQILEKGNLDVLVHKVLAKSLAVKGSNTTSPKTDIKSYQEQENLPPKPEGQGATNIPGEIDMEQTLKGDVKFSKAKELAKNSQ